MSIDLTARYEAAVVMVANFNEEPQENPEYLRGQVELLCDLFGYELFGTEPRERVEADVAQAIKRAWTPADDAPTQVKRRHRLVQLTREHGCANECRSELFAQPEEFGRWALMQADEGVGDNGGPWWDTGDNWRKLLDDAGSQEHPEDWPAETLYDLDSEWETTVTMVYMPDLPVPEGGLVDA